MTIRRWSDINSWHFAISGLSTKVALRYNVHDIWILGSSGRVEKIVGEHCGKITRFFICDLYHRLYRYECMRCAWLNGHTSGSYLSLYLSLDHLLHMIVWVSEWQYVTYAYADQCTDTYILRYGDSIVYLPEQIADSYHGWQQTKCDPRSDRNNHISHFAFRRGQFVGKRGFNVRAIQSVLTACSVDALNFVLKNRLQRTVVTQRNKVTKVI